MPVNEDRGMLFISHTGDVYPCPGLQCAAGNVRVADLGEIYRSSQLFTLLRDQVTSPANAGNALSRASAEGRADVLMPCMETCSTKIRMYLPSYRTGGGS